MNIKYYTKFFSFGLPTYMVGCLLFACSKLNGSYDYYKRKINPDSGEDRPSKRSKPAIPSASSLSQLTQELFEAIQQSNVNEVKKLLQDKFFEGVGIVNLCETDPDGNTCLHIAASINKGNENAEAAIMALLLDKMKFLFLCENAWLETTQYKNRQKKLVEHSLFWTCDDIKMQRDIFNIPRTNPLLVKNSHIETPLMIAIKRGNLTILKHLLQVTHTYIGIDLNHHKDASQKDFLDIVLEKRDSGKLACLIEALSKCSSREANATMIHFSSTPCKAEYVISSIFTKKIKYLFEIVKAEDKSFLNKCFVGIYHTLGLDLYLMYLAQIHVDGKYPIAQILDSQGYGSTYQFIEDFHKIVNSILNADKENHLPYIDSFLDKFIKKYSTKLYSDPDSVEEMLSIYSDPHNAHLLDGVPLYSLTTHPIDKEVLLDDQSSISKSYSASNSLITLDSDSGLGRTYAASNPSTNDPPVNIQFKKNIDPSLIVSKKDRLSTPRGRFPKIEFH